MEQEERPAISPELTRIHLLIWIQSVLGTMLLGPGLFYVVRASRGPVTICILGSVFLWMLSFAPLRKKAEAIPVEVRSLAPDPPRWLVWTAGLGQICCSVSMLVYPWGALILPANLLVGAIIFIRLMVCHGMDLPTQRSRWAALLLIFLFGTLWNAVFLAAVFALNFF